MGVALIAYYVVSYLMITPPLTAATGTKPRVHLTLQTVASYGHAPHVDWVSYLARNPSGKVKKSRPNSLWLKVALAWGCKNSIGSSSVTTWTSCC